jgi:hypothetical protein
MQLSNKYSESLFELSDFSGPKINDIQDEAHVFKYKG